MPGSVARESKQQQQQCSLVKFEFQRAEHIPNTRINGQGRQERRDVATQNEIKGRMETVLRLRPVKGRSAREEG